MDMQYLSLQAAAIHSIYLYTALCSYYSGHYKHMYANIKTYKQYYCTSW